MASEGWTVVARRRSRAPVCRSFLSTVQKFNVEEDESSVLGTQERRLIYMIEAAAEKVRSSPFFNRFLRQARNHTLRSKLMSHRAGEIVVYGLGSISESDVSRCQFALALLMQREILVTTKLLVYDPIMSAIERRVLREFGCCTIGFNEQGRRKIVNPTLFYMPHCEVELYENVLQENWGNLEGVVILGNSFQMYKNQWNVLPPPGRPCPCHVLEIQPVSDEYPINDMDFPSTAAFNDLSWHFFPQKS